MACVIAEPCIGIKCAACIDACPTGCIHPYGREAGFTAAPQLYIDPAECITCGSCISACPVSAIFANGDLPDKWKHFAEINAGYFGRGASSPIR